MRLFNRNARIRIGDKAGGVFTPIITIQDLRIAFNIEKTIVSDPNTATIEITNLNSDSRNFINESSEAVVESKRVIILEVGYGTSLSRLYEGEISFISHELLGTDWVTKVECDSGKKVFSQTLFNFQFAGGATVESVFEQLKQAFRTAGFGIIENFTDVVRQVIEKATSNERSESDDVIGNKFLNGLSVSGALNEVMDKLAARHKFEWSIQDDLLQLTAQNNTTQESIVELTPTSGLLGRPIKLQDGRLKAKALIIPSVKPGRKVKIVTTVTLTEFPSALFKILRVLYTGDTRGNDWTMELEAKNWTPPPTLVV